MMCGADQYPLCTHCFPTRRSSDLPVVSGADPTLKALETTFQQDLNGDGTIGLPPPPPPTVIEAAGSTRSDEHTPKFQSRRHVVCRRPVVRTGGALMVAGQIGGWAP